LRKSGEGLPGGVDAERYTCRGGCGSPEKKKGHLDRSKGKRTVREGSKGQVNDTE